MKKGFTLVELLVVIAIIGILTAIITANLAASKSKARDAKRVSDLAQVQLALELFFDRCNGYPANIQDVNVTIAGCPTDPSSNSPLILGAFISQIPHDPLGPAYTYVVNSTSPATDYVMKAQLENASGLDRYIGNAWTGSGVGCSGNTDYCVLPR